MHMFKMLASYSQWNHMKSRTMGVQELDTIVACAKTPSLRLP